jgi:hypothetical protein
MHVREGIKGRKKRSGVVCRKRLVPALRVGTTSTEVDGRLQPLAADTLPSNNAGKGVSVFRQA